ncbi:hypothetical protein L596_022739 [Steinernema carpocapsae]|uniref:C-type lectin domain-containing protein n=1 Tax=Steinernema carpocapsae TaxID=34508 RepID=A0A4V6A0A8_STECR|nr:hypothetical protein L596_022739 [Steinernema carpocapsae]
MSWQYLFLLASIYFRNSQAASSCPKDAILSSDGSKCFYVITVESMFDQASLICHHLGFHYASITNEEDNMLVSKAARKILRRTGKSSFDVRLGGSFSTVSNSSKWDNGDAVTYTNYMEDDLRYVNYSIPHIHPIMLDTKTKLWKKSSILSEKPFVCQGRSQDLKALKPSETCPEASIPSSDGKKCFYLVAIPKTCTEASLVCSQAGLQFASITCENDNTELSKIARHILRYTGNKSGLLLGGEYNKESKKVLWENGDHANYSNYKKSLSVTLESLLEDSYLGQTMEAVRQLRPSNCIVLSTETKTWKTEEEVIPNRPQMPFLCEKKLTVNSVQSTKTEMIPDLVLKKLGTQQYSRIKPKGS